MKKVSAHANSPFAFGKNWQAYAAKISQPQILEAEKGLLRLLDLENVKGRRFLDIGCGSGIHSLAALRLGVRELVAVDVDADSIATTRALLEENAPGGPWRAEIISVFDLNPSQMGAFDVVYSWGVLHHTGDLLRAIRCAAAMVGEKGWFIFSLYRRTWMDSFWRWEKRWYAHASPAVQSLARNAYVSLFRLRFRMTGRSFQHYVENYFQNRGMDFYHDVHDWLGGYPYETITPAEVESVMQVLGFIPTRLPSQNRGFLGRNLGIFGSGCDEYVYRRV